MLRTIDRTDCQIAGKHQLRRADRRKGKRPTILLSPRALTFPESYPGKRYWDAVKRSVESYDLLRERGHNVKILSPSSAGRNAQGFIKLVFTEELEKKRPGSTLVLDTDKASGDFAVMWPRDRFQIYGDLIFSQPESRHDAWNIITSLGFPASVVIERSVLGEGGLVVRAGKTLVISEAARSRGIRRCELECLRHRGYGIHFLPTIDNNMLDLDGRKDPVDHIDTEFGLARTKDGKMLACVNSSYYYRSGLRQRIDNLVKELNAILHVTPEEESTMAVNFITLPDGKVIMAGRCPSTQAFLEWGLGKENVTALPINPLIYLKGGGLRCMSNVIE
jgi:N-dimethylarginine dimethylaminohydrolase